jgi:hypothetical protein
MSNPGRRLQVASPSVQARYEGEYLAACGRADFIGTSRPRIPRKLKRLFVGSGLAAFINSIETRSEYLAEVEGLCRARDAALEQARRTVSNLPRMALRDTIALWGNAIKVSADPTQKTKHLAAIEIVRGVDEEWIRRCNAVHSDDYFRWPSTEAPGGDGSLSTSGWLDKGLLSQMGYRVGAIRGEEELQRRKILDRIFAGSLPPILPQAFLNEWGSPHSASRLQKMAESIAAFCRNAKRQRVPKTTAITEWECDLEYLYNEYYVARFHFAWPSTQLLESVLKRG